MESLAAKEFVLRLARGMIQSFGLSFCDRLCVPHRERDVEINTSSCTSFIRHRYTSVFYTSPFFPTLHSFFYKSFTV
jgi:hypothetical protein